MGKMGFTIIYKGKIIFSGGNKMSEVYEYKSRTAIIPKSNPTNKKKYIVAVDYGYSTTKVYSENKIAVFPSFAKKIPEGTDSVGNPSSTEIEYRDNDTGERWYVGEIAQSFAESSDTDLALYGRNRYFAPSFKVIAETGIGIGMMDGSKDKPLFVQTGLPPKYRGKKVDNEPTGDDVYMYHILKGKHNFSLRVGNNDWVDFNFTLGEDDIAITDQPKGGLISSTQRDDGTIPDRAKKIPNATSLVLDIGFGTADIYKIVSRKIADKETMDDMGMKKVFEKTIAKIEKEYNKSYTVIQLQSLLQDGNIRSFDRMTRKTKSGNIEPLLNESSKEVCYELINKILDMYDISEFKYVILDGGTAEAWSNYIKEYFYNEMGLSGMISVISAVRESTVNPIFGNARGYYLLRNYLLSKE